MNKYLLIAEKPSLMKEIRSCYNKHRDEVESKVGEIQFMALAGHVCVNCTPDEYPAWKDRKWNEIQYPMIPEDWLIRPIKDARKVEMLKNIKETAPDCDGIIVATDSDVEGYGVYYLVEKFLKLGNKPTLRFIEHSLTDKEILEQLLCMTDFHKDPVHVQWKDAFLIRSRADWLFGMNCTRVMSNKAGQTMRVGRVKAPTIKLIYDNSMSIENFTPENYYIVEADYGDFTAYLANEDGSQAKFKDLKNIGSYPLNGIVKGVETKRSYSHAPKLFDLTTLQAEASRAFGYTPARVLEIVQSLYEKRFVSYPRTQCRYVSKEKAKEFEEMLSNMGVFKNLGDIAKSVTQKDIDAVMKDKQVVNDKEVQKEAHDAILPTTTLADVDSMTGEEKNIYYMICSRLLMQFLPKASDDKTVAQIQHGDDIFIANGKTVVEQGWRVLFKEEKDKTLSALQEGQEITAKKIKPVQKTTSPPKRLTQATLINAMKNIANLIEDKELKKTLAESQGIGTSSTRANIIKEILESGYAQDKKGGLYITPLGKSYIESLQNIQIVMPEFAALMDMDIKRVQNGEETYQNTYDKVVRELENMCKEMDKLPEARRKYAGAEIDIKCPLCGEKLEENKYYYQCKTPNCEFKVNKTICGKEISKTELKNMIKGEPTKQCLFTKKDGKKFKARLKIVNGKVEFDFDSGIKCPVCGADNIKINNGGAFCDCGFKAFRKTFGTELTDNQLNQLLTKGETKEIKSFYSKKTGKNYSGILYIADDNTVKLRFPQRKFDNEGEGAGL